MLSFWPMGRWVFFLLALVFLQLVGCATYRDGIDAGLAKMEQGEYSSAISLMERQYSDKDDLLLQRVELGLLHYLNGDYSQAIEYFDRAEDIAEQLYTQRASDMLLVAMSSPLQGPYRGAQFEKVFIHYYKSLCYLQLAQNDGDSYESLIEKARVETRKVDVLLSEIAFVKGDYQQARERKQQLFGKMMRIFNRLNSGRDIHDELEYREDAYIRYLNGIIYELNGEYDNARIAYQKSAVLYEEGFAKQYGLPSAMVQQAWLDTLRMMKRAGGYGAELERLQRDKLDAAGRGLLAAYDETDAQVIILQHLGVIPHRSEMNLHARINPVFKELVVNVVPTGRAEHQQDQVAWFQTLYAERGVLDHLVNFHQGGVIGTVEGVFTKKIALSPVWDVVEGLGLDSALGGTGMRLTVPYYPSKSKAYGDSLFSVNGETKGRLIKAQSLASIAVNEQIFNASSDFNESLARESVKNLMAYQLGEGVGASLGVNGLLGSLSKIAMAVSSSAETRNWLTLPYEIRVMRVSLPAGQHQVTLQTQGAIAGEYASHRYDLMLRSGEQRVLMPRTINHHLESKQLAFVQRNK